MKKVFYTLLVGLVVISTSCTKSDPDGDTHEEELITTLKLALTANGTTTNFQFQDLDGDGGNAATQDTIKLAANTTYTNVILLSNDAETPAEDITAEVSEEGAEHQFFFATTVNGLEVAYTDQDVNGKPIGLATTLTTGAAGSGTLTVTLRHEPNKSATGVSTGDITNAGGESDIEVTFDVVVE